MAHYLRALAARVTLLLQNAPPTGACEAEAWSLLDTVPLDLVRAILLAGPPPDAMLQFTPERWRPAVVHAGIQTADCGLSTAPLDEWAPQDELTPLQPPPGDSAAEHGSALRGVTVSRATLAAASAALADVQWLRLETQPLQARVALAGAVSAPDATCAEQWRTLEALLARVYDPAGRLCSYTLPGPLNVVRSAIVRAMARRVHAVTVQPMPVQPSLWPRLEVLTQLCCLDVSRSGLCHAEADMLAELLPRLPCLAHLNAADCKGQALLLHGCAHAPRLRSLNISTLFPRDVKVLMAQVAVLTQLHSLDISGHQVYLPHLWDAVGRLPQLHVLEVQRARGLQKPHALDSYKAGPAPGVLTLFRLNVAHARGAFCCDMAAPRLSKQHLRELNVLDAFSRDTSFIEAVAELTGLQDLSLELSDGRWLSSLTALTRLHLHGCRAVPCLTQLQALRELRVSGSTLTADNIEALHNALLLRSLEVVHLRFYPAPEPLSLGDLIPAAGATLARLQVLDVAGMGPLSPDCNTGLAGALTRLPALRSLAVAATPAVAAAASALAGAAHLQEVQLTWRDQRAGREFVLVLPVLLHALAHVSTLRVLAMHKDGGGSIPLVAHSDIRQALAALTQLEVLGLLPSMLDDMGEDGTVELLSHLPNLRALFSADSRRRDRSWLAGVAARVAASPPRLLLF